MSFVSRVALLLALLVATPLRAASPDVVISQVYGGGGNAGATLTHDFIELFNRGASSVNVTTPARRSTSATPSRFSPGASDFPQ